MTMLWQDLRFGVRMLRKSSAFAVIAILTLALGIGATTTIYSVVDSLLLHPLPYKNADRLATPAVLLPDQDTIPRFPVQVFLDFKEQNHSFEDVIGLAYTGVHYRGAGVAEQFMGGWVTPNTFEFLGIEPLLGRQITREDGKPGSPLVFAMSYALWTKLFHRDRAVLGATLTLNGTPRTLVAIMPPDSASVTVKCGYHWNCEDPLSLLDLAFSQTKSGPSGASSVASLFKLPQQNSESSRSDLRKPIRHGFAWTTR
jgi:putative ABC transport system permease protein